MTSLMEKFCPALSVSSCLNFSSFSLSLGVGLNSRRGSFRDMRWTSAKMRRCVTPHKNYSADLFGVGMYCVSPHFLHSAVETPRAISRTMMYSVPEQELHFGPVDSGGD